MEYKTCAQSSMDDVFQAFQTGYSDYLIPLHVSREQFEGIFFGPEGNSAETSILASDGSEPVGLILGGARMFDGRSTMRCGTICVAPGRRKEGIGGKLLELHREQARAAGCSQLFLEVLSNNATAIRFYEAAGYRVGYTLKYYSYAEPIPAPASPPSCEIRELPFEAYEACRGSLPDCHINWQNDVPYFAGSLRDSIHVLGAFDGARQAGTAAVTAQGRLCFLYVAPDCRNRGIARALLNNARVRWAFQKMSVSFPDNAALEGFLRKTCFQKDPLEQYEMYLPL